MELAVEERVRFLETACTGDSALRTEVEALLAQDALTGGLEPSPSLSEPQGRRIGAFALVREIGSGGMGKVYLAEREDGDFRQRVAIKVIKRGMDTEDILRRFKLERQLLAGLEHPNIARPPLRSRGPWVVAALVFRRDTASFEGLAAARLPLPCCACHTRAPVTPPSSSSASEPAMRRRATSCCRSCTRSFIGSPLA